MTARVPRNAAVRLLLTLVGVHVALDVPCAAGAPVNSCTATSADAAGSPECREAGETDAAGWLQLPPRGRRGDAASPPGEAEEGPKASPELMQVLSATASATTAEEVRQHLEQIPSVFNGLAEQIREEMKDESAERDSRAAFRRGGQRSENALATCSLKTSSCPISKMKPNQFTAVLPDPEGSIRTGCVDPDFPFEFEVIPGDSDKLLIFFQGGGACWDAFSTFFELPGGGVVMGELPGLCYEQVLEQRKMEGIFDRTNQKNPFRKHTVLYIDYCSGDAHVGNAVQPLKINGRNVTQSGYNNTRVAVDWVKGNVDKKLSALAIAGFSAGSIGAQAWARDLLAEFSAGQRSYARASVLLDSYAGIFPSGVQPHILGEVWRACGTPLGKGRSKPCGVPVLGLTLQDIVTETMAQFPQVSFSFVASKADIVQRAFFAFIALTLQWRLLVLSADDFYTRMLQVFAGYSGAPNWGAFLVDGGQHGFVDLGPCPGLEEDSGCKGSIYDARASGPLANLDADVPKAGNPRMITWVAGVEAQSDARTRCWGQHASRQPLVQFSTEKCDAAITGKPIVLAAAKP